MFAERLSYEEFRDRFSTEQDCMDYLYQAKWPLGFVCPECGYSHAYMITTRNHPLYEYASCHHQTSLTVGTILEGTRTDLRKWFIAFYLVSTPKSISALKLKDIIHVTYKTAWSMLHKIRHAISVEDASCPLSGSVFVSQGSHGRIRGIESLEKLETLHVGASITQQEEPKHLKIKLFNDKMDPGLKFPMEKNRRIRWNFMREHVVPQPAHLDFYYIFRHKSVFELFKEAKQWIYKNFNGLCHKRMQPYLDEVCFRINMRLNDEPVFATLVELCMNTKKEPKGEVADSWVPSHLVGMYSA